LKIKVGVLGATGLVGQRFVQFLQYHPYFRITDLIASDKSSGKRYGEACSYDSGFSFKEKILSMDVKSIKDNIDCDMFFSALPSKNANKIENDLAKKGFRVLSNAGSHRMDEDVPLLIPEVNPDHIKLIDFQKKNRKTDGFIVTNPNCTTTQLVLALKPLNDAFGVKKLFVTSLQALSGAGYPGVKSLDIIDNIIPYIGGEEEKIEEETGKLLGRVHETGIKYADLKVTAHCNRVNVSDGHLECVSVELNEKPDIDTLKKVLKNFKGVPQKLGLPSAPKRPIVVMEDENRPQPRLDRNIENGMSCIVGRIREDALLDYKFIILGHNTIRGAAGGSILNAELLHAKKYI